MTTDERKTVGNMVKCVNHWYTMFKHSTNNVSYPYINGKHYELVTYGYKELFDLCNTIQVATYVRENVGFNSYYLRCFFKTLDTRIMGSDHVNVEYINVLKVSVIRCAIEALH